MVCVYMCPVSMSLEDHLVKRFRGRSDSSKYFDQDLFLEFWRRVALDVSHYTNFHRLPVPWVAPWVRLVMFGEEVGRGMLGGVADQEVNKVWKKGAGGWKKMKQKEKEKQTK